MLDAKQVSKKSQSSVVRLLTELLINDGKDGRKPLSQAQRFQAVMKIDQERQRLREARKHRRKYTDDAATAQSHLPGQKFKRPVANADAERIAREDATKSRFFDSLPTEEAK
jgi:hypothetical protein